MDDTTTTTTTPQTTTGTVPPRSRSSPPQNLPPLNVDHARPPIPPSFPTSPSNGTTAAAPPPPLTTAKTSPRPISPSSAGAALPPSGLSPLKKDSTASSSDLSNIPVPMYKVQRRRSLPGLVDTSKQSTGTPPTPPTPPGSIGLAHHVRRVSSDRSTSDGGGGGSSSRPSSTRHTRTVHHRTRFSSSGGVEVEQSGDDDDDRRSVDSHASVSVTEYTPNDRDRAQSFHAVYGEVQSQKRMEDTLTELREFHKRKQNKDSLLVRATQGAAAAAVKKMEDMSESRANHHTTALHHRPDSGQTSSSTVSAPSAIPSPPATPSSFKDILTKMRDSKGMNRNKIHGLLRGGVLVETRIGAIQIGVPPETIKDSMDEGFTPNIFVLPQQRFHRWQMISVAELEFPCFWNFFILPWTHKLKPRATRLVVSGVDTEKRLEAAFREALLGPLDLNIDSIKGDFDPNLAVELRPDINREREYFGQNNVNMFLDFVTLKKVPGKPYTEADLGDGIVIRLEANKEREYSYVIVDKKAAVDPAPPSSPPSPSLPPPIPIQVFTTNGAAPRAAGTGLPQHRRSASDMTSVMTLSDVSIHERRPSALSQMLLSTLKASGSSGSGTSPRTTTGPRGRRNSTEMIDNISPPLLSLPHQPTAATTTTTGTNSTMLNGFTDVDEQDDDKLRRSRISSFTTDDVVDVHHDGSVLARVPDSVDLPNFSLKPDRKSLKAHDEQPFVPPTFGVTFLGTSHGFDPKGSTTGFVVWINGVGMLVDPPPNSGPLLERKGIPHRMIRTVFVTHCHADHDAGTLQKILLGENVTVITTDTIIKSFLYKYSKLTNIPIATIKNHFIFRSARVNQWMDLFGGQIRVFYAFHTIPCVGFEIKYAGKSIAYSADTFYDPTKILDLCARSVLTYERARALLEFPFDADLILHEAGVPPIHTRLECLQRLTADVKHRLYLVHIAPDRVTGAAAMGLKAAQESVTLSLNIDRVLLPIPAAITVCGWIRDAALLRDLTIEELLELLTVTRHVEVSEGQSVTNHVSNDSFIIIGSGAAYKRKKVMQPSTPVVDGKTPVVSGGTSADNNGNGDQEPIEVFLPGDCIFTRGENDTKVVAMSKTLQCLVFQVADVECFKAAREGMQGGGSLSYKSIMRLTAEGHPTEQFEGIPVLDCLTLRQLTLFASLFSPIPDIDPGQVLWTADKHVENVYVIVSGKYELRVGAETHTYGKYDAEQYREATKQTAHLRQQLKSFHAGDETTQFLCDLPALWHHLPCTTHLKVAQDCTNAKAFVASAAKLLSFLRVTPQFLFRMHEEFTKGHGAKKDRWS